MKKLLILNGLVAACIVTFVLCTTQRNPADEVAAPPTTYYVSSGVPTGLLSDMWQLGGYLYEPPTNWWNLKVKDAPLDPNSASIINTIKSYDTTYGGRLHPDFTPDYGIPYCVVSADTPLERVTGWSYPDECDTGWQGVTGYPIPVEARTNKRYIENAGATSGDRHLLMFDKDRRLAFELSYVAWDGAKWTAKYGAIFDLATNYRRDEGDSSTDAAGLCVLAGLVRYDELMGPWPIRHALRCSIKKTNGYVWPASHKGSSDSGAPPLGMRLRLRADYPIPPTAPPWQRKLLTCLKTYGLIVADRGGNMYIQGTMDSRWDNGALNPFFHGLNVRDFEVVKLGWKP